MICDVGEAIKFKISHLVDWTLSSQDDLIHSTAALLHGLFGPALGRQLCQSLFVLLEDIFHHRYVLALLQRLSLKKASGCFGSSTLLPLPLIW